MSYVYLHNPRCSKSREGLELLKNKSIELQIREYLKVPLIQKELADLFSKLGKSPSECVRKKEQAYLDLGKKLEKLSDKEWLKIIADNPVLLERPILIGPKKAAIGRPPVELLRAL